MSMSISCPISVSMSILLSLLLCNYKDFILAFGQFNTSSTNKHNPTYNYKSNFSFPPKKKNHQFNITYNWSKFSLFLSLSAFRYGPRVSGSSTISLRFLSLSDQAVVVGWARLRPAPCLFPIPIPHLLMALTTKISNKLAVRVSSYHLIPLLIASFLQFILLLFKQILRFLCLINDLRVVSQLAKLSSSYLDCLTR